MLLLLRLLVLRVSGWLLAARAEGSRLYGAVGACCTVTALAVPVPWRGCAPFAGAELQAVRVCVAAAVAGVGVPPLLARRALAVAVLLELGT